MNFCSWDTSYYSRWYKQIYTSLLMEIIPQTPFKTTFFEKSLTVITRALSNKNFLLFETKYYFRLIALPQYTFFLQKINLVKKVGTECVVFTCSDNSILSICSIYITFRDINTNLVTFKSFYNHGLCRSWRPTYYAVSIA